MSRATAFFKDVATSLLRSVVRQAADPERSATPDSTPRSGRGRSTSSRSRPAQPARKRSAPAPGTGPSGNAPADEPLGRSGPTATVQVDQHRIGAVRMTYTPSTDGDPDPGEIVWTWVPYAENDGRGKDRPVLVVAGEPGGTVLAVQLTSKPHDGDGEFVSLGSGAWDAEGRPSWVNIERVLRVHPNGMRREATALDGRRYATVKAALQNRYGWG